MGPLLIDGWVKIEANLQKLKAKNQQILNRLKTGLGHVRSLVSGVTIFISISLSIWFFVNAMLANKFAHQAEDIQVLINELLVKTVEIESDLKSYIVTINPLFLESIGRIKGEIYTDYRRISELTVDDPVQQTNLIDLDLAIQKFLKHMDQLIKIRQEEGLEAAAKLIEYRGHRSVALSLKPIIEKMNGEEESLLKDRLEGFQQSSILLVLVTTVGVTLIFYLLKASNVKWHKNLERELLAERQQRSAEERLRIVVEHGPIAVAVFDREMRYLMASKRWIADYGIHIDDLKGRSHRELFPEIGPAWWDIHLRCLEGKIESSKGEKFHHINGAFQWIKWEVRPWCDADGNVGGTMIFSEDITTTKEAEESLRASEERFRALANSMPQIVWTCTADGQPDYYNLDLAKN